MMFHVKHFELFLHFIIQGLLSFYRSYNIQFILILDIQYKPRYNR